MRCVGEGCFVVSDVMFFFDPSCLWTWRASRWLTAVAGIQGLEIEWRALSLALLRDPDAEVPAVLDASTAPLRLVEALVADERDGDAGRFYTELGTSVHEDGEALTLDVVRGAAARAGVDDAVSAVDDRRWDEAIRASFDRALNAAGPDVGSPVLVLPGVARGLHGPILGSVPDVDDSMIIWNSVTALMRCPDFFEVKRGRRVGDAGS